MRSLTLLLCIYQLGLSPAHAETTIATPSKDNTLYEHDTGGLSNGIGAHLFAGTTNGGSKRRAALAFDLASIPSDASINSVALTMNMSRTASGSHPVGLHRLLSDWGEGVSDATAEEGTGASAEAGDATWIHSEFDSTLWTAPGGDYNANASATLEIAGLGSYTWTSTAAMVADVQAWVLDPSSNFGWMLVGDESANGSAKRFDSGEHGENRPTLSIEYTPTAGVRPARTGSANLTPTKDNSLFEDGNGALSSGGGQYLFVGRTGQPNNRRALLAFGFSAVPSTATITSAALKMNLSRTSPGGTQTIAIHKVLGDWGESTSDAGNPGGSGTTAATGDATWLHTFSDSVFWTAAGGDFSTTNSASLDIGNPGEYTWASTAQLIADIQGWIETPATNFGWILIGNESASRTAKRFDSREHPTGDNRPELVLTYTYPNNAPTLANPIPDQQLIAGQAMQIDLSGVFSDRDGDGLSYTAVVADSSIATVAALDGVLSINPLNQGTTTISLIATDGFGGAAISPIGLIIAAAPNPLIGDFNGSNSVDFDDFFIFADNFGQTEFRVDTDLDGSGAVNFDDFFIFADHFGTTASQ